MPTPKTPKASRLTRAELLAALATLPAEDPEGGAEPPAETTDPLPEIQAYLPYRIVHLGTSITSTFAILEPGGNISARKPFVLESEFLTEAAMVAAVARLQQEARRYGQDYLAEAPPSFSALPD